MNAIIKCRLQRFIIGIHSTQYPGWYKYTMIN